ncbi:MAG: AF1514 family protein [Gammaproteobacteria bacterium]|nr:AF1514 family protein [Gammaproteobacteria bacterium]
MEHREFDTVNLEIAGELDYTLARKIADEVAENKLAEPMILAWYDGIKEEEHPEVPECQHKPGWIAYAEGHGGKLQVNVNKDMFSFIYRDGNS